MCNRQKVTDPQKIKELEEQIRNLGSQEGAIPRPHSVLRGARGADNNSDEEVPAFTSIDYSTLDGGHLPFFSPRAQGSSSRPPRVRRTFSGPRTRGPSTVHRVRRSLSRHHADKIVLSNHINISIKVPRLRRPASQQLPPKPPTVANRIKHHRILSPNYDTVEAIVMKILFVLILLYLLPVAAGTSDACQFLKVDLSKLEKEYQHYSAAVTMLKEVRSSYLPDDSQFVGFTPGGQVVYILSKSSWKFKTIYDNETYTGLEKICTEMGGLPNKFGANDLYHVFNFTATYGYENEGQVLAVRSFREGHVVWMDGSTCFLQTSMSSWIDTSQKRDDLRFIGYRLSWDGVIIKETPIRLVPPPYTIIDMPLLCMIPNKITVKMAKLHRRIARFMDYKFHEYNSTIQNFSKLLDSIRAHHLITSDIADSCPDLDLVNLQWPSLLTSSPT